MRDTNAIPLFERMGGRPVLVQLLKHFYADVRQHAVIGPIFAAQIGNWPEHIEKIADFWTQVAGGPAGYGGGMPARHIPLGLQEAHFQAWLGLWETNCKIWLPPQPAAEMIALAGYIGQRLRLFCNVAGQPATAT